jgi:hypothetical protein
MNAMAIVTPLPWEERVYAVERDARPGVEAPRGLKTANVRRVKRLLRAVKLLLRDDALPRWLRGLAAFAALPIPGPVDEVVLVLVAAVLWIGYRERLRSAWRKAA